MSTLDRHKYCGRSMKSVRPWYSIVREYNDMSREVGMYNESRQAYTMQLES